MDKDQPRQFEVVTIRSSRLNVSGSSPNWARQQRRSTYTPRRKSTYEDLYFPKKSGTSTDSDISARQSPSRRPSWLEKVRRKSMAVTTTKGRLVRESKLPDFRGVYSARFLPTADRFITSYGSGAIQLWRTEGEDNPTTIRGSPEHGFPIMCVRFLPSEYAEQFFAAGADGTILLCGLQAGKYNVYAREQGNEINALDVNSDGNTLITGGKDAVLRIYDVSTGKLKGKLERVFEDRTDGAFHSMRIFAIKFHNAVCDTFLTGGWDDCVKIWDLRVKNGRVRDISGPHICGDALDVREQMVLTGSWVVEKSLQVWDFQSGRLIETLTPFNRPFTVDGEFLYSAQFLAGDTDSDLVVSGGSGLGKVEVTNINEKKVVMSFKVQKTVHAIDTAHRYVVFGGMESVIRVAQI